MGWIITQQTVIRLIPLCNMVADTVHSVLDFKHSGVTPVKENKTVGYQSDNAD